MGTISDDILLAPEFTVADWKKLDIPQNGELKADWPKAIDVFEHRMNARFMEQIEALKATDNKTAGFSGFAIVALDCLLIETLAQFYNGHYETPHGRRSSKWAFWRKSTDPHVEAFHLVFQLSPALKAVFDTKDKTRVFYQQIRCGLLHQAQTKGNSRINRKIKKLVPVQWCDARRPNNGLIVHPLRFHECVKDVFSDYLKELRNPANRGLRKLFRRKMNRIAGMS